MTGAHTLERQEALAVARTQGKKFFMTGGEHVTSDNMFKAVEINMRIEEARRGRRRKRVGLNTTQGARPHSPSLVASKMILRATLHG